MPLSPRQLRIDEKTALIMRTVRFQKTLTAREGLHDIAVVLEYITHALRGPLGRRRSQRLFLTCLSG